MDMDNRNAFGKYSLTKFLMEYEISELQCENPNREYSLGLRNEWDETILCEEIQCDGEIKEISCHLVLDRGKINLDYPHDCKNSNINVNSKVVEVIGASWAIKTTWINGKLSQRILYTCDNPQEIKGLPKIKQY